MGRWLVILSLAVVPFPNILLASPPLSDIPLPKRKPANRDHHPAPIVKAAVATPRSPGQVAEPDAGDAPAGQSPVDRRRDVRGADAGRSPVRESMAQPPADAIPVQSPDAVRPGRASGDCSGGKRIISAYYWEGQRTASGQRFDPRGMTAAHRTLPFGTRLTVSNPRTGKSVTVVINDRGPFVSGISLDLSLGAAQAIGMRSTGAVCISTASTAAEEES